MKTLLQNSEKERDKCWLLFKTSLMETDAPTNFRVDLFAVPLNVKRVCFVSKLVKLHFANVIFMISS